jgi:hypothetical protein
LAVGIQLSIVWLIAKAIRASVLRVREYYADSRADLWGAQQGLRMLLRPKDSSIPPLWKQIRGWWKLHPTPAERLATIDNPGQLFKFSLDLPFLVGFLMAIISFGAFSLFVDLAANQGFYLMAAVANMIEIAEARTSYLLLALAIGLLILAIILATTLIFIPVFAISYLMSHVLGLQFIREGLYFQVMGKVRNGCSKQFSLSTLLWVAGLELGFLILPVNYGFSPFYSVHSTDIFLMLLWWICASILIWLWLFFAYQIGTRWLAYHVGTTLPRWRLRIVMTVMSGALWLFLIPLAASRTLILFGSSSEEAPFLLVTALGLVTGLFFCGLLWVFTWIFTRRVHCMSCKRPLSYDQLNHTCTHCGAPSLSWLLLPQKRFSSDKEMEV